MTEDEARKQIKIGDRRRVVSGWYEASLRRQVLRGEIVEIRAIDEEGDPVFGPHDEVGGSVFASDWIDRTEPVDPDLRNAEAIARGLRLGAYVIAGDGSSVRGTIFGWNVEGDPIVETASGARLACAASTISYTWHVEHAQTPPQRSSAPDESPDESEPEPAAEEDRKPRGVKPPLALIPWSVVPDRWRPETLDLALDLTPFDRAEGSTFATRVIRILLETAGDDLMYEIARVMDHGAAKYGIGNWQTAEWNERARVEYESAMLRHLYADAIGEPLDPDSGFAHKAHAAASAMIMEWHERRDRRAARASSGGA